MADAVECLEGFLCGVCVRENREGEGGKREGGEGERDTMTRRCSGKFVPRMKTWLFWVSWGELWGFMGREGIPLFFSFQGENV